MSFHLDAAQKGFMVSVPIIAGALIRFPLGVLSQYIGCKNAAMVEMGHRRSRQLRHRAGRAVREGRLGLAQAFIAMHWGDEFLSGSTGTGARAAGVNALTSPAFCPSSKQPELKHAAVKIIKAELPWKLLGVAWLEADDALRAREQLKALMQAFAFAACVPFGRERAGVLFRAAAHEAPLEALLQRIEGVLGLTAHGVLHYADKHRGQRRSMRLWCPRAARPASKPSCSPATSAQRPGSSRCCRTNCLPRPTAGCC